MSGHLLYLCLVFGIVEHIEGNTLVSYREFYARAIPLTDMKLDSVPLRNLQSVSRTMCLEMCLDTAGCAGYNYGSGTGQCEILGTYLCEGTASLAAAAGFMYYDVENSTENIGIHDDKTQCSQDGKCSPKCPGGCQWTSLFDTYPGYYVVGFTKETLPAASVAECEQHCVAASTFLCKSADYSSTQNKCFMSHITKEDVPSAYMAGASYTYIQRLCQV